MRAPHKSKPKSSRPYMPGYGMMFRNDVENIPWRYASTRFSQSRNYWLATVNHDNGPHVMPIWGVWVDNRFYFSTGPKSRKARNLRKNRRCVILAEDIKEAIIIHGNAEQQSLSRLGRKVIQAYKRKYDWKLGEPEGPVFMVRPTVAFGFMESGRLNPTRWSFD